MPDLKTIRPRKLFCDGRNRTIGRGKTKMTKSRSMPDIHQPSKKGNVLLQEEVNSAKGAQKLWKCVPHTKMKAKRNPIAHSDTMMHSVGVTQQK